MITITSHMMKKLWTPVLVFIILLVTFISILIYGIRIDGFTIGEINVRQLYIKLDKKLIVEVLHVKLPASSSQSNAREEIVKLLEYLPWLNQFFDTISIGTISYADEEVKLTYKNDVFYLDSDYLTIDAKINPKDKQTNVVIKQLLVKDFNLELRGDLDFDLINESGIFKGSFFVEEIGGDIALKLQNRQLSYLVKTDPFTTLEPFMKNLESHLHVEPQISEWVYQRIKAKEYQVNSLSGVIDLNSGNYFPQKMLASAKAKDVSVKFHDDVAPALIENLDIELKNNQLFFGINSADFEGISINRSSAYIYNLFTEKNGIVLTLQAQSPLDERIDTILRAYDINLPIKQTKGTSKSVVELDIGFNPFSFNAKGYFILKKSVLEIENEPFDIEQAFITLDNDDIFLDATRFSYKDFFDITTEGVFNTKSLKYNGIALIDALDIQYQNSSLLKVQGELTPILLDLNDGLFVQLPDFKTTLSFKKEMNIIDFQSLLTLKPYALILNELQIEDGKMQISTKDFKEFLVNANIKKIQTPFIKDNKPVNSLAFHANINENGLKLYSDGIRIEDDGKKEKIYLQNIDLMMDANSSTKRQKPIKLFANNSQIYSSKDDFISFKRYEVLSKDEQLELNGTLSQGGEIYYSKNPNALLLEASSLSDASINSFAKKRVFKDGTFSFFIRGLNDENYSGKFDINSSYLVQMSAYNNLIALINTIPSMAFFKSPGFNEDGYEIKKGNILFSRQGDILTLHIIELNGVSADIEGFGIVNLKDKTLEVDLQLKTLKDISGVIDKIPLVNYIVLGKDKSISTAIKLTGNLYDPKVETQVLQDSITSPFNILKRTIELPFKLFSD